MPLGQKSCRENVAAKVEKRKSLQFCPRTYNLDFMIYILDGVEVQRWLIPRSPGLLLR